MQERIDDRLRRIANFLLLNAIFIDNLGVPNSEKGSVIFVYQNAFYTENKMHIDYSGEFIDELLYSQGWFNHLLIGNNSWFL